MDIEDCQCGKDNAGDFCTRELAKIIGLININIKFNARDLYILT